VRVTFTPDQSTLCPLSVTSARAPTVLELVTVDRKQRYSGELHCEVDFASRDRFASSIPDRAYAEHQSRAGVVGVAVTPHGVQVDLFPITTGTIEHGGLNDRNDSLARRRGHPGRYQGDGVLIPVGDYVGES
jgi:hypothetical protein